MRVLCVNSEAWPDDMAQQDNSGIIENGECYTVVDVFFDEGYIWYVLAEDEPEFGYWENAFARTSDICEHEMRRVETTIEEPAPKKKFWEKIFK